MRIKMNNLLGLLLPLCLLGFMGSYLAYLNHVFTYNTRWLIFAALLFLLIIKNRLIRFWDPTVVLLLTLYLLWCFLTSFWSQVFLLSIVKSAMLIIVVLTMVTAGIEWVISRSWDRSFNYLGLLAYIVLLAAFFGRIGHPDSQRGGLTLYRGSFITGANMVGFYMAAAFPYFLWKAYIEKANKKKYLIHLFLVLACAYFLLASMSRGAIVATLVTLTGFMISLNMSKKITLLFFGIVAGASLLILYPEKVVDFVATHVYKTESKYDVFSSRRALWQQSYDAALEGGWFGLGYAVTAGDTEFNFDYGLTSSHYGREKGNSQLAVVEETGVVGLIFYAALLMTFIFKLIRLNMMKISSPQQKVLTGILSGIFMGMIVQSVFEGWWDAPGGPETAYFWILVGVMRGLEIAIKRNYSILPIASQGLKT